VGDEDDNTRMLVGERAREGAQGKGNDEILARYSSSEGVVSYEHFELSIKHRTLEASG